MLSEPPGCAFVVGMPVEVVHEKPPARAEQPGECRGNGIQLRVVERHDGDDRIEGADAPNNLGRFPDQAWLNGSGRVHAERIEAKFPQTVNQAAVTTANVEDSRARGKGRRDGRVEILPPAGVSHTPENYLLPPADTSADHWNPPVPDGPRLRRENDVMGGQDLAAHWDDAYGLGDDTRSWFQQGPRVSLRMLDEAGFSPADSLVDVGGGSSPLAGALLDRGFKDVTVLDIAGTGMQHARARLGDRASQVQWVVADVLTWQPDRRYQAWHDRAVFHAGDLARELGSAWTLITQAREERLTPAGVVQPFTWAVARRQS